MAKKAGIVSLSVHRNTLWRRKRQEAQRELCHDVRRLATSSDCRAYALVVFDANGEARAIWDTGRIIPEWAFADAIAHVLREDIGRARVGRDDDFQPPEDRA